MGENLGFQAVAIVNGNISRRINVDRGCQQGNPIAGYLFILAIENFKRQKLNPTKLKLEVHYFLIFMVMI